MMELLSSFVVGVMPSAYCSAISLPCAGTAMLCSWMMKSSHVLHTWADELREL